MQERESDQQKQTKLLDLKDFTVYHKEKTTTISGTSKLTSVTSHVPCHSEEFREDPLKKILKSRNLSQDILLDVRFKMTLAFAKVK